MLRHCKRICLMLAAFWPVCCTDAAHAYDEQIGIDVCLGHAFLPRPHSLSTQATTWDLGTSIPTGGSTVARANAGYALLHDHAKHVHAARARVEMLYMLDILQFVPFVGLGSNLLLVSGAPRPVRPGLHLLIGADYLITRSWLIGLDLRSGAALTHHHLRNITDVSLRVSRLIELF